MEESVQCAQTLVSGFQEKENLMINYNGSPNSADIFQDYCYHLKSPLVTKAFDLSALQSPDKNDTLIDYRSPSSAKRITPRKPLKPLKSADQSDPSFQGVFIKVRSSVGKDTDSDLSSPQLIIDSFFTYKRRQQEREDRARRRKTKRMRSSMELFPMDDAGSAGVETSGSSSSSPIDFESEVGITPIHVDKICASCNTSRTPLWRDAEDGTHLCNACGIRWKKYRIRCLRCWYIPRKEEKNLPSCPSCCSHGSIRFTISKRHIF